MSLARRPLLLLTLLAVAATVAGCRRPDRRPPQGEFARHTNLGKAQLENRNARAASASFETAVELAPGSAAAWRNLARARLLARRDEAALEAVERAAELEADAAATSYLGGLVAMRLARVEDARARFEEAVRLDPETAALRYQLAGAYQSSGLHEKAREQLEETLRLDPLHSGAHYKLLGYARRNGERAAEKRHELELARLRRLFGEENRAPEAFERCRHTRAETVATGDPPPEIEVRFRDVSGEILAADEGPAVGALGVGVVGTDSSGAVELVLVDRQARAGRFVSLPEGGLRRAGPLVPTGLGAQGPVQVLAGDFFHPPGEKPYDPLSDARNDVALVDATGVSLLLAAADGLVEVTGLAGLGGAGGGRGRWTDTEQDGDLDLVIAGGGGVELWRNNGEGGFEEVSAAVGIELSSPALDVAAADLDANLGVDLVVARPGAGTRIFDNQRAGRFRGRPDPPGDWPAARRVLADDVDGDGLADAVLLGDSELVVVTGAGRRTLPLEGLEPAAAALVDYDNDGRLDLLVGGRGAAGEGTLELWRNTGPGSWSPRTRETGLAAETGAVEEIVVADVDGDGDSDLLLVTNEGLRVWSNDGGNAHGQLKVRLVGTKTNSAGLGARLEVRRDRFVTYRTVSALPIEIGLGAGGTPDTVGVVWTNGIVDNEIDPPTGAPLTLVEKNVAAGSCPFLYAWDGSGFRFVTDILGNSPLGLSFTRAVPLDADPDEYVEIGGSADLAPRDGFYVLQVTEEMREVLYLDEARLVAVDHRSGVEVHATDKLMPAPFPPSELVALRPLEVPRLASGSDGIDRTRELAAVDGRFAPPGRALPPPFRGATEPLSLVLDFGPIDVGRPLTLMLTGWLQYGDASTNIALSQGSPGRASPPRLEAEDAAGRWRSLPVTVGMPAGKTKTILVDLAGVLPPGARRLRLTTGLEIRWDRIALGERLPVAARSVHAVPPTAATLGPRGFSEIRARAPGHPTTPVFDRLLAAPRWRTALAGWATRYGDVNELAASRDGRLVLVGPGDAVRLEFDAGSLPPVPAGLVRTFFFYSVGWDKDGDPNVIDGERIEPLPDAATDGPWRLRYNTRWIPFRATGP